MTVQLLTGDCRAVLQTLASGSVSCAVTSPPYFGLRDYGVEGQMGLEPTPDAYVEGLIEVFREVRRVLRADGTLWLNLGDSYAGSWGAQSRPNGTDVGSTLQGGSMLHARQIEAHPKRTQPGSLKNTPGLKPKDLIGIPWRVAFALQADGWWLRQDIIWSKPNPMPESVADRCTKAHEYLFMLSKSARYYFDPNAIAEQANPENHRDSRSTRRPGPGQQPDMGFVNGRHYDMRNKRSVWTVATAPFKEAHFATFPPKLIEPCVLAGSPKGGTVLDPFSGAGTTALVADRLGRNAIGIDLNPKYTEMAQRRLEADRVKEKPFDLADL